MDKKNKKAGADTKFEGFFKLRKKTPKSGVVIKSKKDKKKEKRIKPKDLKDLEIEE